MKCRPCGGCSRELTEKDRAFRYPLPGGVLELCPGCLGRVLSAGGMALSQWAEQDAWIKISEQGAERRSYTVPEAAKILQVSKSHMYELIDQGKIRSIRLGERSRRIPAEAIDEYLQGFVA